MNNHIVLFHAFRSLIVLRKPRLSYTDITELSPELLRLFIEKIVVGGKAEKYSCTAEQRIWIYYRDVGLMDTATEGDNQDETFEDFDNEDEFEDYLPTRIAYAERTV